MANVSYTDTTTTDFEAGTLTQVTAANDEIKLTNYTAWLSFASIESQVSVTNPENTIDGDTATVALYENDSGNDYITWDIGEIKNIEQLRIYFPNPYSNLDLDEGYYIDVSTDNSNWTRVVDEYSNEDNSIETGWNTYDIDDQNVRYVKFELIANYDSIDIAEMQYAQTKKYTSGNIESDSKDLSAVGVTSGGIISWNEQLNGHSIIVETNLSLDNGSTWEGWQPATNGGNIPDITNGTDLSNALIKYKASLSSTTEGETPILYSVTITVNDNSEPSITFTDNTYPELSFVIDDPDGTIVSAATYWQAADEASYTQINNYGSEIQGNTLTHTILFNDLAQGDNYFKVTAEDDAAQTVEKILTFNLDNIRLVAGSEEPVNDIKIGKQEISAKADTTPKVNGLEVTIPEKPDYRLIAKIADSENPPNISITNLAKMGLAGSEQVIKDSKRHISDYCSNGETSYVHHIFEKGKHYITLQARLENGETSEAILYNVDAFFVAHFISEPEVNTTAPKANKITVRSPTSSAVATTDPPPASDQILHKIININSGDTSVCQETANRLIERWGNEQISITGEIDLNVNLKFKNEIKITIPNLDIDDFFILQRKKHFVTDGITSITVGDIQLSDAELISRILEDLGA